MSGVNLQGQPWAMTFADTGFISPFGQVNINQSVGIFNSQQQYGDDTTVWETQVAGNGTLTFLPNESTIQLAVSTATNSSVVRQTKIYNRYTPGQGQTVIETFAFDGGAIYANNYRRVGYYDANNGVYLECFGGTVSIVQRSYITGTVSNANSIAQASWNVDTFGAGTLNPSNLTINWGDAQILEMDFQWLGVGRVRVGFNINGTFYPAHYFNNANFRDSVYMTTANLPCRYENYNTGTVSGTVSMRHICSTVLSGGGVESGYGKQFSANVGGAVGKSISNGSTLPLISMQAATTGPNNVRNTGQIQVMKYFIAATGSNPVFWQLVLNPTLTGASFSAYSSGNSIANIDTSATVSSGGTVLDSGWLGASSQQNGTVAANATIKQLTLVYSGLLNHQDVITLIGTAGASGVSAFAALTWLEEW